MCATRQPSAGCSARGYQGASDSITMIRSASPTSGPESYPAFIGCDDGIATERGLCEHTGMAARSATLANAATAAPSVPGPAGVISGDSAAAGPPANPP